MKKILLLLALCVPFAAWAQERLDSAVVVASRAGMQTPVTFTQVDKPQLQGSNPSHSLPMALNLLPSVVTYNEGGTGLGNSAMTIRGSKGSQINVTLNGITLNDAESQEVFWVNIPALTALLSSVQVQRGLGTSASGAGAFGASINMGTDFVLDVPFATLETTAGSFGTVIASAAASTGRLKSGLYCNLATNLGHTDGYIRGSQVNSSSVFAVVGWLKGRHSLRLTYLMGRQVSGITWDGISLAQYAVDRTFNDADGDTDHYTQHHLQLNHSFALSDGLTLINTLNYTRGDGFDEFQQAYRKMMGNDLWVLSSQLRYLKGRWRLTGGLNFGAYVGNHWGEVLKAGSVPGVTLPQGWYSNTGRKWDGSAFLRTEYVPLPWLTVYADLQYRCIRYTLRGVDDDWIAHGSNPADRFDYARWWLFFNPRAGVTASWGHHKAYASAAIGHREPGRGDIKENVKGGGQDNLTPEKMLDVEAGYAFQTSKLSLHANLYWMEYWDMLLETGRLSTSGYAIKENVPRAWRRGVELSLGWMPWQWLRLDSNATLSLNQIRDYTSYVPFSDYSDVKAVPYGQTTMLMSPSVIGMWKASFFPWKGGTLSLSGKYVGKQYLDNSMREALAIPAYFVMQGSVAQSVPIGRCSLELSAHVDNLLNHLYYAAGWRWETYDPVGDSISTGVGIYPQAPCNFMLKARLSF